MRTRLLLIAALALPVVGAAAPANASCYPQKPQTCHTCRISDVYVDETGLHVEWECR